MIISSKGVTRLANTLAIAAAALAFSTLTSAAGERLASLNAGVATQRPV